MIWVTSFSVFSGGFMASTFLMHLWEANSLRTMGALAPATGHKHRKCLLLLSGEGCACSCASGVFAVPGTRLTFYPTILCHLPPSSKRSSWASGALEKERGQGLRAWEGSSLDTDYWWAAPTLGSALAPSSLATSASASAFPDLDSTWPQARLTQPDGLSAHLATLTLSGPDVHP